MKRLWCYLFGHDWMHWTIEPGLHSCWRCRKEVRDAVPQTGEQK